MKYSVLAVILLSLGCTKKEAAPEPAPSEAEAVAVEDAMATEAEGAEDAAPEASASILTVKDPGSAPPIKLRWQLAVGDEKKLVWESDYMFHSQRE